jgi:hypothetical protein
MSYPKVIIPRIPVASEIQICPFVLSIQFCRTHEIYDEPVATRRPRWALGTVSRDQSKSSEMHSCSLPTRDNRLTRPQRERAKRSATRCQMAAVYLTSRSVGGVLQQGGNLPLQEPDE